MNIFSQVYGKIIKYYLEESYKGKETEIQAGFRAGRSTIDHVFVIKQLIEKANNNRQEVHFTCVDMQKAYDTVPLQKL
jgi:Reverse transcriptase (RNA-dependent DNA polymerase).